MLEYMLVESLHIGTGVPLISGQLHCIYVGFSAYRGHCSFLDIALNSEFQVKYDRISYMTKEVGHTTQLKVSVVQLLL